MTFVLRKRCTSSLEKRMQRFPGHWPQTTKAYSVLVTFSPKALLFRIGNITKYTHRIRFETSMPFICVFRTFSKENFMHSMADRTTKLTAISSPGALGSNALTNKNIRGQKYGRTSLSLLVGVSNSGNSFRCSCGVSNVAGLENRSIGSWSRFRWTLELVENRSLNLNVKRTNESRVESNRKLNRKRMEKVCICSQWKERFFPVIKNNFMNVFKDIRLSRL